MEKRERGTRYKGRWDKGKREGQLQGRWDNGKRERVRVKGKET